MARTVREDRHNQRPVSSMHASSRTRAVASAVALLGLLAHVPETIAQSTTAAAAAAARPMTATELRRLYAGKTWQWPEGAGYFAEDRTFSGWSGGAEPTSVAKGRWLVTDGGQMCFDAQWRYRGGAEAVRSCFRHRRNGEAIYQQKEPGGEWIVFQSDPPSPDDEIAKLREGDLVSSRAAPLERELAGGRRTRPPPASTR